MIESYGHRNPCAGGSGDFRNEGRTPSKNQRDSGRHRRRLRYPALAHRDNQILPNRVFPREVRLRNSAVSHIVAERTREYGYVGVEELTGHVIHKEDGSPKRSRR